jgi:hypothetical protein
MGVADFLENKDAFTHMLFVDADMGFTADNLERLIMWDKDLVGCFGPTKWIHWEHVGEAMLNGRDPQVMTLRHAVNFYKYGPLDCVDGFAKVKDFGLCFCLVKPSMFEKMMKAYPELQCKQMGWKDGGPYQSDYAYTFFDTLRDTEEDRYLECDHAFLARWRRIGGEVWCDMTSNLAHVGRHDFRGNGAVFFMGREWQDGKFTALQTSRGRFPGGKPFGAVARKPSISGPEGYHITIVEPEGDPHWRCFVEIAKSIRCSLEDLGLEVTWDNNHIHNERVNIIFNWHMWSGARHPIEIIRQNRCILFQGEQIMQGGRPLPDWYFQSLIEADAVWDYSVEHIRILKHNKVKAFHVQPGYHPVLETIAPREKKEYDVLFIGSSNLRRQFMCSLLEPLCKLKWLTSSYGRERDADIAKARLVLNTHFYTAQTLELVRLAHLLTNRIPVISEVSDNNPYGDGIEMVEYRELPKTILGYLNNPSRLQQLAQRGYDAIIQQPMTRFVAQALVDSEMERSFAPLTFDTIKLLEEIIDPLTQQVDEKSAQVDR